MSTETDNASGVQNDPVTTDSRQGALETIPTAAEIHDDAFPPNTPFAASTTSFILGGFFSICLWAVLYNSGFLSAVIEGGWTNITFNQPFVQLPFFIGAWAFFHWAEFAVTAGWNREKCSSHSFLLDNGKEYHIAHSVAIIEFVITSYFFPGAKRWNMITPLGILITIFGQVIRSIAMIHASTNFSHMVAYQHREGHRLVKGGIYRYVPPVVLRCS
ncbi:hypothetical protein FRC19_007245 [Serendipita sp. 401]|nr:hypothetical protein FRC19_007245 [Serendipita sp. 401]